MVVVLWRQFVALLSGEYRQSHRQVSRLLWTLFGVQLSRQSINRARQEVCEAVSEAVCEAHQYVQQQGVIHSDETSFRQGNQDRNNPQRKQGWLWVLVTPLVRVFSVVLSRSQATAETLIGKAFSFASAGAAALAGGFTKFGSGLASIKKTIEIFI